MAYHPQREEYEELVLEIAILAVLDVKLTLSLTEQKAQLRYIIKHAAQQMARPIHYPRHAVN